MKAKLLLTLAAIGLALLIPSGAFAACAAGQINLSNNNVGGQGVDVCITVSTNGNTNVITLVSVSGPAILGGFTNAFAIGWNTADTFVSSTGANWSAGSGTGFNGFNACCVTNSAKESPQNVFSGAGTTWTISGSSATPTLFAMHIKFANGCTFVVSNGGTTSSDGITGDCSAIPEPGTMALFGSGLVAIAGIIRRRFFVG